MSPLAFSFVAYLIFLTTVIVWIFSAWKNFKKQKLDPLIKSQQKIKEIIKELPKEILKRKVTIAGEYEDEEDGVHILEDFLKMPELVRFLQQKDLLKQFPAVLKERSRNR